MNKRTIITAVTAALISLPLVLNGAEEKKKGGGFAALDKDGDGKLTKEEFVAGQKDKAKGEQRFKDLDKNNDGKVDKAEFEAGMKSKKKS